MDLRKTFWEETYQRNIKKMIGICFRYVADRHIAEDLAHDAFLTVIYKSGTFKGKGHFDAWIRKVAVNTALMHLRENKRKTCDWQDVLVQYLDNNEDESMWHEFTTQELLDAINTLPEHHRLVFNLYVIDNYTHKEIADILSISEGTSKSHLARARKKLQQILSEKEQDKKDRRLFIFILFPWGRSKIDRIYKKNFSVYEIAPQTANFLANVSLSNIKKPEFKLFAVKSSVFIVGLIAFLIGLITFTSNDKRCIQKNESSVVLFDTLVTQKKSDTIGKNEDTALNPQKNPVVIKKKRIILKNVIVRDTLIIIDTNNAK